jgi:hypothetical protein
MEVNSGMSAAFSLLVNTKRSAVFVEGLRGLRRTQLPGSVVSFMEKESRQRFSFRASGDDLGKVRVDRHLPHTCHSL